MCLCDIFFCFRAFSLPEEIYQGFCLCVCVIFFFVFLSSNLIKDSVCVFVRMFVCRLVSINVCVYVSMFVCICVYVSVCECRSSTQTECILFVCLCVCFLMCLCVVCMFFMYEGMCVHAGVFFPASSFFLRNPHFFFGEK